MRRNRWKRAIEGNIWFVIGEYLDEIFLTNIRQV